MQAISRRLFAFALVAAAALVLAVAVAYVERAALAERWLIAQLGARGVAPVALRVAELGAHGISLRDLRIGPADAPDLSVTSVELAWSLEGLRARHLDAVRIAGLRARGTLDEHGARFGALDPLLRSGDRTTGPPLLPAPEIELVDAELSLATPQGVGSCAFDGRLRAAADGALAGDFAVQLEHPLVRANGTVVLSGTLEQLAAQLSLALQDGREPARVAPATLSGHLEGAPSALAFELALDGANGHLHAEARGTGDLLARSGKAELRLAPLVFAPDGLQPAALLPALEPVLAGLGIAKVAGSVEARGTLALEAGAPALRLGVALREVGLETEFARVQGVSGTIALRAPPLRTAKRQLVAIARLDAGLTLRGGMIDYQLLADGVLALNSTSWQWAGGELRAEGLRLDLTAESTPALLQARGLDLAALLALVAFEGLDGTGRIDGDLPLVLRGDALLVSGGVLRAAGAGGTIRYRPDASTRALATSRPNDLGIAVGAFSNFHYETLEARVDGDVRGKLQIAIHVRGANPDFQSGQPIELNLNLDARLADLVREGVAVYRVPEEVEKRLRAFSEKHSEKEKK